MPDDDALVMQLASAIVDATGPDWAAAESTAANADVRRLIRELRVVAALAAVHCDSPAPPGDPAAEAPSDTLSKWGPLLLRGTIGQGHFGTVYLAWDDALERQVALKLLRGTARAGEIIQEGRLLARVRHPNVVTVYGVDRHDGVVGLWMEFVDGLTLARVVATHGPLNPREAALVGVDLCRAVAAVHKAGLVHRDIKAHNVMRDGSGRIVLMDFGAGELRTERSGAGPAAGTPLYLAPELFDGAPATIASDLYSMGVLLFHLVTKRYPVEGATVEAIAAAHARRERHHLGDLLADVPDSFSTIVERALDRDPARRYRSCDEMQRDLMDAAQQYGPPQVAAGAPDRSGRAASVAVLPFANLGPDKDVEYLSSGLADELLTGLGKVPGLRLASRTSAAHAAHEETDIRRLCRRLGVDAVIEGTVRKSGDQVRITAQLVSGVDGCHLWSDGYDRDVRDVFAVVDDIARSVVDRMKVSLAEVLRRPLIDRHTENARAYEYYLKGRFYWTRRYHGGLVAALDHFKKAIEEDAGYALAFAGLADAYAFIGIYAVQRPRLALAQAIAAAERALALDPALPEAHTSLAFIKMGNDWDLAGAAQEFARALELDPQLAVTRIYYSWLLVLQGDAASAMVQVRAAQETEPLSPLVNAGAGHTLYLARRYDEAIAACEKSLEIDPNFILGTHVIGMCRALQGRLAEAVDFGERAVSMSGRAPFYLGVLGHYHARRGALEQVQAILHELDEMAATRYVPPHCQTFIHAGLNDLERAFEWQAKAQEDGASPFYYVSPLIDNLQADPRHLEQMRAMGWPYKRIQATP
jgi:TolB-like protein/tetratricopeptide (TPR) repeat protein